MEKFQTVGTVREFLSGEWKQSKVKRAAYSLYSVNGVVYVALAESFAASAQKDTFDSLFDTIMNLFDKGVVLVIVFSGACWALGHRGKALEILIGVCCGYILARHGKDIRDALKGI